MNENQILILSHVNKGFSSLTSLLNFLSEKFNKPLSTLKLNAKILKELKLIDYGSSKYPKKVELTNLGKFILEILNCNNKGRRVPISKSYGDVQPKISNNTRSFTRNAELRILFSDLYQCSEEINVNKTNEILEKTERQISTSFGVSDKRKSTRIILQPLEKKSRELKRKLVEFLKKFDNFHLNSSLSTIDILLAIFAKWFFIDMSQLDDDILILSKGHSVPAFYIMLAEFGLIEKYELENFGKLGSRLATHAQKGLPLVKVSMGSLGQGLSIANGIALASKMDSKERKIFVILGDGELDEGQTWEAAMTASHYHLDNIIAIVDRNKNQLNGHTEKIKSKEPLKEKWESFGWIVFEIDGRNCYQILDALIKAERIKGKPKMIIANTSGDLKNGHS